MMSDFPSIKLPAPVAGRPLYKCHFSLLMILLMATSPAFAECPGIGLALSGGGAKGSAHIAVLELLEANQIPVDYIAGYQHWRLRRRPICARSQRI